GGVAVGTGVADGVGKVEGLGTGVGVGAAVGVGVGTGVGCGVGFGVGVGVGGTTSSLRSVIVPIPSASATFLTALTMTSSVSSGSTLTSPLTRMRTVVDRAPLAMVPVPDAATASEPTVPVPDRSSQ